MEIIHPARRRIEPVDADRRLDVLGAVGCALRIRQVEAVDLDEHEAAALDLLQHMGFERVVEREFLHANAIELVEVGERNLEEGELVAFEVLQHGEAEPCRRLSTEGMQDADPQIGIAIGLRPVARAGIELVRAVDLRRQIREHRSSRARQHVSRPTARRGPPSARK